MLRFFFVWEGEIWGLLLMFVHLQGDENDTAGIFFGMIFERYFASLIYDLMRCFYDAT